jgi:hypothetical protein
MDQKLARLSCRVIGHHWIAREYHNERTHEFAVCERCGTVDDDPSQHRRTAGYGVTELLRRSHRRHG